MQMIEDNIVVNNTNLNKAIEIKIKEILVNH